MIVDSIENISMYFHGLDGLDEFILSLDSNAPEGRHDIDSDNVFAVISHYDTRPRSQCRPESHVKYADIQILLQGQETIEWFPLEGLAPNTPYDADKDVAFYERPESDKEGTRIALSKGVFAVFFPQDAHMPQVRLGEAPESVIKVVVKIKAEML